MNTTTTGGESSAFYRKMLEEGPHAYDDEELSQHLRNREFKFCMELIHFDNLDICDLCRSWMFFILDKGPNPGVKIGEYVNPAMYLPLNHAEAYLKKLIGLMVRYGEGACPQINIILIAFNSSLSAIDRLAQIHPSVHLTRAEAAIRRIFYYLPYQGEKTMLHEDYTELLYQLKATFLKECTANAEELTSFIDEVKAKKGESDAAKVYQQNCHHFQLMDYLRQVSIPSGVQVTDVKKIVSNAAQDIKAHTAKATQGSDEGCHHPDKKKDALVQKVILHLAKPGVTFSINDACCKVAGTKRPGHCKLPWLYNWCHRNEKQIQTAIEVSRGSGLH